MFDGLGKLQGELHLRIDATVQPTDSYRKVAISQVEYEKKILNGIRNLDTLAAITPFTNHTDKISIIVARKSSGAIRLCIYP